MALETGWVQKVNWVDLLFVILLIRSTYVGIRRGFVGELFFTAGIILAILAGVHFYAAAGSILYRYFPIPRSLADLICFAAVSSSAIFLFLFVFNLIRNAFRWGAPGIVDRVSGGMAAFVRSLALCILVSLAMLATPVEYIGKSVKRSTSGPAFVKAGTVFYEKFAGLFPRMRKADLNYLLNGAHPLKLDRWPKRRSRYEELEEIFE